MIGVGTVETATTGAGGKAGAAGATGATGAADTAGAAVVAVGAVGAVVAAAVAGAAPTLAVTLIFTFTDGAAGGTEATGCGNGSMTAGRCSTACATELDTPNMAISIVT